MRADIKINVRAPACGHGMMLQVALNPEAEGDGSGAKVGVAAI